MKVNMPVTDHEVLMGKSEILVTRTDLKGIITYANEAFIAISGFSKEELEGKNHNVVRHPDMPAAAFEDLWRSNKESKPWTALVKNRTKNGDFYWVEANVTPVFKNGKVAEFLSVRYAPSRQQIKDAELFYEQLNANKAQMRPKGLALLKKNISEMKLGYKGLLVLAGFLLPIFYLMNQLFQLGYHPANHPGLAIVACISLITIYIGFNMMRDVGKTLESAIGVTYALAGGYYRNKIDLNRNDQIGDFNRALYSMQVKMNADLSEITETATASERIKQALDQVTGNVMMADADLNIIYMNNAAVEMFKRNEADFQKDLPNLNVDTLIGTNIDVFHKDPSHQRGLLARITETVRADLMIGGRSMVVIATPVIDGDKRLGTVVEWIDKTQEVKIQEEIDSIVNNVKLGQLENRIDLADKEGFFAQLSTGINDLTDVVEQVISEIAYVMSGVAEGDLTREITKSYQGTYATCKEDINSSLHKLSDVFGQVKQSAEFINDSSQEIASGNNNLSQRAEQQAANLEQTASSMEELTSTVKNNADNAQQADQVASSARQLAESGGEIVASAISAMEEINDSSNKIAEIIGVIDEIAFQTNLLALNASVEAARAGEQGRGFSVVATEVRNLAQRSATAARESKELIQSSVQKVRSGTEFVNQTGKSLTDIVTGVKKVGDIVAEIAAASSQQSQGIEQVNQAVAQMDEITQQNAALAEQASAASVSMSEQSNQMSQLLAFFKIAGQSSANVAIAPQMQASNNQNQANKSASNSNRTAVPMSQPAAIVSPVSGDDDNEWEEF